MNKIPLVIFTRNRACQLDLLIRSIDTFLPNIFQKYILYSYTTPEFKSGYHKLIDHDDYDWYEKEDGYRTDQFVKDVLSWTGNYNSKNSYKKYILFSTDDTVFFRTPENFTEALPKNSLEVFSFRLGFNTIEQDIHRNTKQMPLNLYSDKGEYIEWNPHLYHPEFNYGYPLSLDTHILHKDLVYQIVQNETFNNPSEFEGVMQKYNGNIGVLRSLKHSCSVNVPVNNMSGNTVAGQKYHFSLEELNRRFLDGEIICLESISKQKIIGCHQEIKYEFRPA